MDARLYKARQPVTVTIGSASVVELPVDTMTVAFLLEVGSRIDLEYPKYVLRSEDGAYQQELSARHDLVPGNAYLELKFERLLPGKRYTLTRFDDVDLSEVVLANLPFAEIVDQPRALHEALHQHVYGDLQLVPREGSIFGDPEAA